MNPTRRLMQGTVAALVALLVGLAPAGAAQGGTELPIEPSGGDTNEAVAVNTEDGASVFRLAFSIRHVTDGTVDQENTALAYASCTDCKTVALAFQVVIVVGGANYVAPVNQAGAVNEQCVECLTFASATQIVIGVDGPVVLTAEGRRRLVLLYMRMKALEGRMDQLTAAQLATEVSAIEQELIAILSEELVPAGSQGQGTGGGASSTTTAPAPSTTTSTTEISTPGTTVSPPTTTTPPSTSATTAPPATTATTLAGG
jgi:putative peptide zinc metalloprotease protein